MFVRSSLASHARVRASGDPGALEGLHHALGDGLHQGLGVAVAAVPGTGADGRGTLGLERERLGDETGVRIVETALAADGTVVTAEAHVIVSQSLLQGE